jgi:tripartite-type tricarboxylate transporter receptor subunit TctC
MAKAMMRPIRRRAALGLLCSALWAFSSSPVSAAAEYPTKPIRMLVGFAAGGTTDLLARLVAKEISVELGQSVVVENKPGAGGNVAADQAARAQPDGYTLIMGAINHAINASLYEKLPYDQLRDLTPVSMVAITPNMLVVPADSPFSSVDDLLRAAKARPGELTFASSGVGTSVHLSGEQFKSMAGLDMVHVPYTGVAPAETDLVAGRVSMMFDSIVTALPLVQAGRLKALAVTSAQRSAVAPDVPTIAEAGLPGFDVSPWYCIFAPAGTPGDVIGRLNKAVVAAMTKPEVRSHLLKLGADPYTSTPGEADQYVRKEIERWKQVISIANVKAN